MKELVCPHCHKATGLVAWYRESTRYSVRVREAEDELEIDFLTPGEIQEDDGEFDELWCTACDKPIGDYDDLVLPPDGVAPPATVPQTDGLLTAIHLALDLLNNCTEDEEQDAIRAACGILRTAAATAGRGQ